MLPTVQLWPRGYISKRREIFLIIIPVIFLLAGGCGGGGESGGSSSSSSPGGSITLAWDAPTTRANGSTLPSIDIKGYWIYYGTLSGTYAERTYAGNATTFTLRGLILGQTYYIAVTAIDTSDNESNLSQEVSGAAK